MNIKFVKAANYTNTGGRKIKEIIIHWWGDPTHKPNIRGIVAHFQSKLSGTSAHYVVSGAQTVQMVREQDIAYHAGNWSVNTRSIGIEIDPNTPGSTYETVGRLVADIWARHGVVPLRPHKAVVPTQCPGSIDLAKIEAIAKKYHAAGKPVGKKLGSTVPTKPKPTTKSVNQIAREVIAGKWGNGSARINKLRAAGYNAAAVQAEVNRILIRK